MLARFLGKEGFGELGILQSTIGSLGVLAGFGLGITATKHVAEFKSKDPSKAGRIMALSSLTAMISGGFISLILLILAPWLATTALAAEQLSGVLQIAAGLVFLNALNGSQTGALSGLEAFKAIAILNAMAGIYGFLFIVTGAYLRGLHGAVLGMLITIALSLILNHIALQRTASKHDMPLTYAGCGKEWKVLGTFSLPSMLSSLVVSPANWACAALLVNQANGYAEMGIFNAANQWHMAILFFPSIVSSTALPIMASYQAENQQFPYVKTLKWSLFANLAAALVLAIPVILLSPFIMASYGETFRSGWDTLALLVFSTVIVSSLGAIGQAITAIGKMWWAFALNVFWAVALLSSFWLLRQHGAFGLATANLISYGLHFVSVSIFALCVFSPSARGLLHRRSTK